MNDSDKAGLTILLFMLWAALIFVSVMADRRLDDLEKRVTTFETIRIEAVVPAKDSG